ncbi:MAG: hypothetical protein Q9208_001186 [Pyrenodesmia sp. 3 TL-2023]
MSSLASTIVPIHSDASASTSVTASPMELLEPLDPVVDFKIPLPEWKPSSAATMEVTTEAIDEGTPVPTVGTAEPSSEGHTESREGPKVPLGHEHLERIPGEEPTAQKVEQGLPGSIEDCPPIRLGHLKDLIGVERYHRSQVLSLQRALDGLTLVDGINKRLLPVISMASQALANCYQSEDQAGFANLYKTCEDLLEACKRPDMQQQPTSNMLAPLLKQEQPAPNSWLQRLPEDCQENFLDFLSRLRTEPDFLADRLSALSHVEFVEFCSSSTSTSPNSIFGSNHQRKTSSYNQAPSMQDISSLLAQIGQFHEGDPFFVLFHGVFDSSCGPRTPEYFRRIQIWSTACAKVITEGKPGSNEFTIATLNAFSQSTPWHLAPRLEIYIGKILQDGAFLLEPASKVSTNFREPLEIRNANAAIAVSKFFDKAMKGLFAMLLDTTPADIMPGGLLILIHSILRKIPADDVRSRAKKFIVSRWYIASFLGRILTYPEVSDWYLMAKGELTVRIESRKTSVSVLDPEMHILVKQLLNRFDPLLSNCGEEVFPFPTGSASDEHSLMLSVHDAASLIRSLCPSVTGAPFSANPSTAGSSTLIPDAVDAAEPVKPSAPSLSGLSSANIDPPYFPSSQPGRNPQEMGPSKDGKDETQLHGAKDIPLQNLENRMIRTYTCLTSLAVPKATIVTDASTMDWAFFTTDTEGKVNRSHGNGACAESRISPSDRELSKESVHFPVELRLCVVQLLGQGDLEGVALHSSPKLASDGVNEAKVALENLASAAMELARVSYNYQEMHYWWQMQRLLDEFEGRTERLLRSIYDECLESIKVHTDVTKGIEKQIYALSSLRRVQVDKLHRVQEVRRAMRMKMWYASDVRHSSTFEEALHVTQALRSMANPPRSKQSSGVANWARQRLKNVTSQDRSTAQTVEALTEPNEYSGTSKLNDDQVERTTSWLTRHSIEDFCRGEERVQRFCFEIQRCVNKLTGSTLLESPVLWSSRLFEREKRSFDRKPPNNNSQSFPHTMASLPNTFNPSLHGYWLQSQQGDQISAIASSKSSPVLHASSPKEPVRSLPFRTSHAPTMMPDLGRLSSLPGYGRWDETSKSKADGAKALFTAEIKKGLSSLILSDLGYPLWNDGTETDGWVKLCSLDEDLTSPTYRHGDQRPPRKPTDGGPLNAAKGTESNRSNLEMLLLDATDVFQDPDARWRTNQPRSPTTVATISSLPSDQEQAPAFPYEETYKKILERFSFSQDPQTKLLLLHELEHLVSHSIQHSMSPSHPARQPFKGSAATSLRRTHTALVPRTKATSFEEVMANCTERRAGTLRFSKSPKSPSRSPDAETFGTDEIVNTFLAIFRDLDLRPSTLFRDLQYIAAFVPPEILDQTPQGKAFWDAGLAALALKQELCDAMVTRATRITNYHISASSSSAGPLRPPSPHSSNLIHTTFQDAAHLWIIAAKEGSATAARELGLLYLTHPELLPRTILKPFSKPNVVFKMVGAKKEGATTAVEEGRLDPVTFAVVFHWMEVAANGGDKDARDFLRGNGEWGVGR